MKNITLYNLFLQTFSVCILASIVFGSFKFSLLEHYEKTGYLIGSLGIGLIISGYIQRKFNEQVTDLHKITLTLMFTPLCYMALNWISDNSVKLISDTSKASAMTKSVKRLTKNLPADASYEQRTQWLFEQVRFSNDDLRQIYIDSISLHSGIIQSRAKWSADFNEKKINNVFAWQHLPSTSRRSEFNDQYLILYFSLWLTHSRLPFFSRSFAQQSYLKAAERELFNRLFVEFSYAFFIKCQKCMDKISRQLLAIEDNMRIEEQNNESNVENFMYNVGIMRLNKQLAKSEEAKGLSIIKHDNSRTLQQTFRLSLTLHLYRQAGIKMSYLPVRLALPYANSDQPYEADNVFIGLVCWTTPHLCHRNGTLIFPMAVLKNPIKTKEYLSYLETRLPDSFRSSFKMAYITTSLGLMKNANDWQKPIALSMYSHYIKMSAVLPIVLLFSVLLLAFNFYQVSRESALFKKHAIVSVASGLVFFFTPLKFVLLKCVSLVL